MSSPPVGHVNETPWLQSGVHTDYDNSFDTSLQWDHVSETTSGLPSPNINHVEEFYSMELPALRNAGDWDAHNAMDANNQEIRDWFAGPGRRDNWSKRTLPRRKSLYRNPSQPITIQGQFDLDWTALNPMQRWQNSPPEHEAASVSAISNAVAATDLNQEVTVESECSSNVSTPGFDPQGFNFASKRSSRPASVSSIDSGTSNGSMESMMSSWSCASRVSTGSGGRKIGRISARVAKPRTRTGPKTNTERIFQCTFCCDTFKNRYDWARHEKSLHLNLEQWICTPESGIITCASTAKPLCAYCLAPEPSTEHLESHNYRACANRPCESKSFKRKDHLLQHLRLVHKVDSIPGIGQWRGPEVTISSRCGFCGLLMADWKSRTDHLSKHFRDGEKMIAWRGDHGFDPQIASQVANSMPPYLIGSESKTLIPFSATKPGHQEHLAQMSARVPLMNSLVGSNAAVTSDSLSASSGQVDSNSVDFKTCWEFLTFHLGQFAQEKIRAGVVPTDEMFQQESRRIWYDSDDPWNQTVADCSEWMEIFRRENGLHQGQQQ